jgi:hypothetical protein
MKYKHTSEHTQRPKPKPETKSKHRIIRTLCVAALLAMPLAPAGCSSVVRTAYMAEGTSIATADTAMQLWRDWV